MALKLFKSTDQLPMKNLLVVIYGQPGVGKTSLAFTAENPVLLDFDRGVERVSEAVKMRSN